MEALLYLAKVNLCWVLFYSCYWLLFKRHTFFKWNRAYLLVSLLASFAIPLITFSEDVVIATPLTQVMQVPASVSYPEATVVFSHGETASFDWTKLFFVAYLAGAAVFFFQLIKGLLAIRELLRKNEQLAFDDYTLILLPLSTYEQGSFSFFNWLMVSQQDYEEHLDTVLRHELVHIRQKHSYDIIFIEILKVIFWFNPIVWLYKKSLQEVHEFLADEGAPNRERYATFLIGYGHHSPVQTLTNPFFSSSLLKSRIKMIYKNRTSRWLLGKYLMIIPVLLVVVSVTAAREHIMSPEESDYDLETRMDETKNVAQQTGDTGVKTVTSPVKSDETVNIKGQVVNKDGLSIKNATLVVKNTKIGVSADHSGRFSLNNVP
ncbi:MAG TPA: M56 family metallopeptidase, partial [Dyadobacter sp.]|nr:M56 family metallopeptidase [Dyadobacter sp.]